MNLILFNLRISPLHEAHLTTLRWSNDMLSDIQDNIAYCDGKYLEWLIK